MGGPDLINAGLPDDLLVHVFHLLAAGVGSAKADLDSCALACRRWHAVERASRRAARVPVDGPAADVVLLCVAELFPGLIDVTLDQGLCISVGAAAAAEGRHGSYERSLTDMGLLHLVERCKRLEKLTLNWFLNISAERLVGIANSCRNLQSLALWGGCVQDPDLIALAEGCNLNDLTLRGVQNLTDEGLIEFVKIRGKSLVSLEVICCPGCITDGSLHAIGSYCGNLEVLCMDSKHVEENEGMISVAKGCLSLKSLKLSGLGVGDEALEAFGSFCSALEILSLDSIDRCTDRNLFSIADRCKKLKNLFLSSCLSIQTAALEHVRQHWMNLLELSLSSMWVENNAFLQFGQGCFILKSICLASCSRISDEAICNIAQGCKNLRKLSITSCRQIGDEAIISVGQNCKELRELTLHFLGMLTDTGLAAIDQCCYLQKLDIYGCKQITENGLAAVVRECCDLIYMDISNNLNVGDTALAMVGQGCPKLKHLRMLNCNSISDDGLVHIAKGCLKLEICEVFWCSQITLTGVATLVEGCCRLQRLVVEDSKVSDAIAGKCRIDPPD